jgi:DNA-binding MarR family transcriptional regulator
MAETTPKSADVHETRIMLNLLSSLERGGEQSQRRLASDLGVALGLVNAYLKRCIKKGLVKVGSAPARRYAYYLTPRGFAEKSRLTIEYLSYSFSLFRDAKSDYAMAMDAARANGFSRLAIMGVSDLAEIAVICALDKGMTIVAIVDGHSDLPRFVGAPVVKSLGDLDGAVDAVLVADIKSTRETIEAACARLGADRVLVPALLGPPPTRTGGSAR